MTPAALIQWPVLALLPALGYAYAYARTRLSICRTAALAWFIYLGYELAIQLRWLCSGDCNIRVDLLLIYPLLVGISLVAAFRLIRFKRR